MGCGSPIGKELSNTLGREQLLVLSLQAHGTEGSHSQRWVQANIEGAGLERPTPRTGEQTLTVV